MTRSVLIMTCGHTDVQLVDQGRKCKFDKDHVGALHDRLRDCPGSWTLVDAPPERGDVVKELPEGRLWEVCAPKFDAVLAHFGPTPPSFVLLLESKRTDRGDPRFAGDVLQMRAKAKGIDDVRCFAYLGPADRYLEDRDCPLDSIIRRDVVRRIEVAIRDAVKEATSVVVACTGGMPEIKALVKELVRLHAPAGVEPDEIEVDDGARSNGQLDKAVSRRRVDPIEPIRLRKQALALVEKGNLIGAWGAVQHLEAQAHPWTLTVEWLYCFAASLPMPAECDSEVLNHQRMAVRAALRVELALRAGDVPRAVHGTVAFFEAALWDRLLDGFERTGKKVGGLELLRIKEGVQPPAGKGLLRDEESDEKEKKNCPFKLTEDGMYLFYESGAGRFARDYAKSVPLKELLNAVEMVRPLRNDVAHNEPTPELMNEARATMQRAALWSSSDTFLSQSLVQAVLRELGEANPENLLNHVLAEVRQRIISPTFIAE